MSGSSGSRDWGDRVIKRVNKFVANVCLGLMAQCAIQDSFDVTVAKNSFVILSGIDARFAVGLDVAD